MEFSIKLHTIKSEWSIAKNVYIEGSQVPILTLNAPNPTKVVCFSHLLKCLRSLYGKPCGPRSDCSGSTLLASILNSSIFFAADDFSRRHFQIYFFLDTLRVKNDILFLSLKIIFVLTNSADPDEMLHYAAFHLGLHCLSKNLFMGFRSTKLWVNMNKTSWKKITQRENVNTHN